MEILKESKSFQENQYKKHHVSINDKGFFPYDPLVPLLTVEEANISEGGLNEDQCATALLDMENDNKSPGSDCINVETDKIFWNDLKKYLIKAINYAYDTGDLSQLQKKKNNNIIT